MKNLPTTISNALESNSFTTFVLVDINFSSNPLHLTSLPYGVTVGSTNYISDGGLEEYSPPSVSTVVDRETYRIRIVDNSNALKNRWDTAAGTGRIIGTPVTVRLGVNDDTSALDIIYQGRIDGVEQDIDFGDNQKTSIIECSSPFADLSLVSTRLTTQEFQQAIQSTDTCFNDVGVKIDAAERRWGKKGQTSGGGGGGAPAPEQPPNLP